MMTLPQHRSTLWILLILFQLSNRIPAGVGMLENSFDSTVPDGELFSVIRHLENDVLKVEDTFGDGDDILREKQEFRTERVINDDVNDDVNQTATARRRLPSVIIIGVKKCGTRALLEFMKINPGIKAMGPEAHFFDKNYQRGLDWYRSLMPAVTDDQVPVEKTPSYFITRQVPERIHRMSPDTRLIVVVRNPVTRAISDYTQAVLKRPNLGTFEHLAFLDNTTQVVNSSWGTIQIGIYARHMRNWFRYFPRHQIHIVDGENLIWNPAEELRKVENFVRLNPVITKADFYFNSTKGFPCVRRRTKVPGQDDGTPHCLGKTKGRTHPNINPVALKQLSEFFVPFNLDFYEMTGIDFGWR